MQAPPRADVVKGLKNGIMLNLLGMGAAILGMQATVGLLVAKALTSSANPYYQGISPGSTPVLALDVFLVQVCLQYKVVFFPPEQQFYLFGTSFDYCYFVELNITIGLKTETIELS